METITDNCTGCQACTLVCPVNAISYQADAEGFRQPVIDSSKCIDCGLCVKKCPVNAVNLSSLARGRSFDAKYPKCFGGWSKNERDVRISSSGGIFSAVARYVLRHNGIVFGATFTNELMVHHKSITKLEQLDQLRRSKYLQSDTGTTYAEVKEYLTNGRTVLYTGTNCQIAGLRSYLGVTGDDNNLITIDVVCHGVPSPQFFKQYANEESRRLGEELVTFNFRHKPTNWGYQLYTKTKTKTKTIPSTSSIYMEWFLKDYVLRESCYKCPFVGEKRVSDLTIGDFWGVENTHPTENNNWGISAIICNTAHGFDIIRSLEDDIYTFITDFAKISQGNPVLIGSVQRPEMRNKAFLLLKKKGIKKLYAEFERSLTQKAERKRFLDYARIVKRKLRIRTRIRAFLKGRSLKKMEENCN